MIILKGVLCQCLESVEVELPRPNMIIDPHPNYPSGYKFECVYHDNGKTVTLTRTDRHKWRNKNGPFYFRAYDPALENVPNFYSTVYLYMGVDRERAPYGTTVLFIDSSVKVIKRKAFFGCVNIKKCYMSDGVHTIEEEAFKGCGAMRVIRLSRTLEVIEEGAFSSCDLLDALFLPPCVKRIDDQAFSFCDNIRILPLPLNIDISHLGEWMLHSCDTFFNVTQLHQYHRQEDRIWNHDEVHRAILNFYRDLHPLHKTCLNTNVSAQTVQGCIDAHGQIAASATDHDGMTPLHILSMNPHADVGAILTCFDANMSATFTGDARDMTPLDYLREYHDIEDHTSLVTSLCMHRYMMMG